MQFSATSACSCSKLLFEQMNHRFRGYPGAAGFPAAATNVRYRPVSLRRAYNLIWLLDPSDNRKPERIQQEETKTTEAEQVISPLPLFAPVENSCSSEQAKLPPSRRRMTSAIPNETAGDCPKFAKPASQNGTHPLYLLSCRFCSRASVGRLM